MKIRKILCGILAGVLICTGNPVISQGKVQAQLQVVRSKTMTVTLEASGGRMVKKASVAGTVTLPSDRNGSDYTFLGWSTKRGQTRNPQYQAYETIKVTRNMHLYPVRLESGTGYQCEESGGESGSIFQNYFRRGFTYSNDGTDSDRSVPEQCQ